MAPPRNTPEQAAAAKERRSARRRERRAAWTPEQRAVSAARHLAWYHAKPENKERVLEANARWRADNPGKGAEYSRQDYERHGHKEERRSVRDKWRQDNPERARQLSRDWARQNKGRVRESAFLREYGITIAERDALFAAQGFSCAVCGSETPKNKKGKWHTDHCHKTGKVRGVLCLHCNHALGHALDNPSTLDLLAQYVRHHAR